MATNKVDCYLQGTCDKEYEPVQQHLEHMLRKGCEDSVQLCVYVDNKCVIDLYGSGSPTDANHPDYNSDTIQTVFSSGKSLEAIVAAMLVDQGLLSYTDKVAKYWPEFAQNGKEDIKVCDVLRHESGLAWFKKSVPTPDCFLPEKIKENALGSIIETEEQHFAGLSGKAQVDTRRDYHAFTRGLLMNEIIRRADSKGRTIGEILREDIAIDGVFIGLKDEELKRAVMTTPTSFGYILGQSLTPKWAGKRVDITFPSLVSMLMGFRPLSAKYKARPPFLADSPKFSEFMHTDIGRKGEISSSGAQCNARGLAKLAAIMANKGQPVETQEDNKPLMSEATWEEMHSEPTLAYDGCFPDTRTNFTKGGLNYHVNPENPLQSEAEGLNNNREGFYGWFGFGGSLFQWHPELKIGFAFVPTKLHALEMFNNRASVLQQLVKDCATAKFDK